MTSGGGIVAANLVIEPDDFEYAPFAQEGGLGKAHKIFGGDLNAVIEDLNVSLAA
jgi:type I restriction enzyme R subunit